MFYLPYDTGLLKLDLASGKKAAVLEPPAANYPPEFSQEEIVQKALENPVASAGLADLAQGKQKILIITSDHTRPVPSGITMPLIIKEIKKGNPNAEITLLIATGLHRPTSQEELLARFGALVLEQVKIVIHNPDAKEDLAYLGLLPSGGELWLNRLAVETDLLLAEGFIEPHFFAGFSGGRKSVLPGIASRKTVLFNHNAQFIDSPYARTGILENNPIHEDMIWAAEQAKLAFIVNVVINAKKEIIHCVAGDPNKAHLQGCKLVRKLTAVQARPADIVITTNGGYPLDQNVYQAVKGMTGAEASAKPGAVIIIAAGCRDGMGGDHFYHQMADFPNPQAAMEAILATPTEETAPDQWQSQILARVLIKHKVIMVTDPSLAGDIKKMHLEYAPTIEEALSLAKAEKGAKASITIIPDGVGVIVEKT